MQSHSKSHYSQALAIENMIEQQIRPWGVLDQATLSLFQRVQRENFLPSEYRTLSYCDTNIPLYQDQIMFEPKVQAHIVQALQLNQEDRVLLIGAGWGFLVALIACLCREIIAYEVDENCFLQANQHLQMHADQHALQNITLLNEDGLVFQRQGLFDKIVICGTLSQLPQNFIESLQVSGRLIYFQQLDTNNALSDMKLCYKGSHHSVKEETLLQVKSSFLRGEIDGVSEAFLF